MAINPKLSGVYTSISGKKEYINATTTRGRVALPLDLNFGVEEEFTRVTINDDFMEKFGESIYSFSLITLKECLKNANEVYVYRLNDKSSGAKSKYIDGATVVEAKYTGSLGDKISFKVEDELNGAKTITVYLDLEELESQTIMKIEDFQSNFINITGSTLNQTMGQALSGGQNGVVTKTQWLKYLDKVTGIGVNAICVPTEDKDVLTILRDLIINYREKNNGKVVAVCPRVIGVNHNYYGIIQVANGVVLGTGEYLDNVITCAWVAGATSSVDLNSSLTNLEYPNATLAHPSFGDSTVLTLIKQGNILFRNRNNKVIIESDVNSLVTLSNEQSDLLKENKTIRILDQLQTLIEQSFYDNFIGKQNTESNRITMSVTVMSILNDFANNGIIGSPVLSDITIEPSLTFDDTVNASIEVSIGGTIRVIEIKLNATS